MGMDTVCIGYPLSLPVIVSFGPWLSVLAGWLSVLSFIVPSSPSWPAMAP